MALAPPRNLPARPLTVSVCGQPRRRKEEQEQKPVASLSSAHGVDLPCRPRSTPTKSRTEFRPRADQRSAPTISSRFRPRADQRSTPTKSRTEFRRRADQRSAPTRAESGSAPTHSRGKLSKAGWVRWQGCERHGCRDQAPMDGFTASPATGPTPPSHRKPAFDVDVDVDFSRCRAASPARRPNYSGGVSRTRWMSVGVDSGIPRSASICSRLKYRSLRVPYTCLGLAT